MEHHKAFIEDHCCLDDDSFFLIELGVLTYNIGQQSEIWCHNFVRRYRMETTTTDF